MTAEPRALSTLREIGPVFRSKDAVAAGVSWRDLYALRDQGEILELSRGLYQLPDATGVSNVDFVAVCGRAPRGMICLNSALAYWDLSDEIPAQVHLAVPSGSHRPVIDYPPTQVHVFHAGTFAIGRLEVTAEAGERFWVSDRERTVADAVRLRHLTGDDLAYAAVRRYLQSRPSLARLADVARPLRAWGPLSEVLRILQS
ncbi:MAG TPA: type IV toxin-antitoxin system AbiEi family antitoxin domain-containing protein [Streptosporangiaceae bacterium]|jgi:predicted transcriptional regulator of viral defense system